MRQDPIALQPYDPQWPALFEQQRVRLVAALEGLLAAPIEHIGSTSIPGLAAKPIVDMLALVDDRDTFAREGLPRLQAVGWVAAPEPGDHEQRRISACYPSVEHRTHHLHVVALSSAGWPEWLAFRDHLRSRPDLVDEYARIKRAAVAASEQDRPRYRAAKAPFIRSVLDELGEAAG